MKIRVSSFHIWKKNCLLNQWYLETEKLFLFKWFDAVCDGKIEVVEKYLKSGWDVNTVRNATLEKNN
jgi:hypothetical protein